MKDIVQVLRLRMDGPVPILPSVLGGGEYSSGVMLVSGAAVQVYTAAFVEKALKDKDAEIKALQNEAKQLRKTLARMERALAKIK